MYCVGDPILGWNDRDTPADAVIMPIRHGVDQKDLEDVTARLLWWRCDSPEPHLPFIPTVEKMMKMDTAEVKIFTRMFQEDPYYSSVIAVCEGISTEDSVRESYKIANELAIDAGVKILAVPLIGDDIVPKEKTVKIARSIFKDSPVDTQIYLTPHLMSVYLNATRR